MISPVHDAPDHVLHPVGVVRSSLRDLGAAPRQGDEGAPAASIVLTRSSDRPNPLGLHRATVLELGEHELMVDPLEAIDGTPVVDIKPVLRVSS